LRENLPEELILTMSAIGTLHHNGTLLTLLVVASACLPASTACPGEGSRPNVLFFVVDDLNDWVGFLGGYPGKVHTPNIDRLAKRGTAFTNAHTAAPVCCPSRAAAMLGRLPSSTGIYNNQQWWKPHLPKAVSMPAYFRHSGYRALGSGKIFHHTAGNNPPSEWDAFRRNVFLDNAWAYNNPQGRSASYPWTPSMPIPKGFPFSGIRCYSREVDWGVLEKPERELDDVVCVDWVIDALNAAKSSNDRRPFYLACGVFRPHMPWYVPRKYADLYPLEEVVLPKVPKDDLDDVPAAGQKLAARKSDDLERIRAAGLWKEAVRMYLASISFADAQVGRLIDAVDATGLASETVIVLWSDHGWHLGEKGHWHKRTLWEEATRVPMIIVAPGRGKAGTRCARPVSTIDLFPTLLALCGLPTVDNLDGRSLAGLIDDPTSRREAPAITVDENRNVAVRGERYRYILYQDGSEELYDHHVDQGEWRNVAGEAALADVKRRLRRWVPRDFAPGAPRKNAYDFDSERFLWRVKRDGRVINGRSADR